jgi:hypothetical protein
MNELDNYLIASKEYYDKVFDKVEHSNIINGVDVDLHFKYLQFNPNGIPKVDKLVEILFSYFTHYCFSSRKRSSKGMSEIEKEQFISSLKDEARELFRKWKEEDITPDNQPKAGEVGEMILWLLIEVILKAPQVVAKMDLKTNPNLEVFGSDGIHVKIDDDNILNLYFGEAKFYNDIYGALDSAFESIEKFHENAMHKREYNLVTTHYKYLDKEKQDQVFNYITNEIKDDEVKIKHACLIGYDWDKYQKLSDVKERQDFIDNFTSIYEVETKRLTKLIQTRFDKFSRKEFSFDVFFLPFKSVQEIRNAFNEKL